jgi:hypothetical protein
MIDSKPDEVNACKQDWENSNAYRMHGIYKEGALHEGDLYNRRKSSLEDYYKKGIRSTTNYDGMGKSNHDGAIQIRIHTHSKHSVGQADCQSISRGEDDSHSDQELSLGRNTATNPNGWCCEGEGFVRNQCDKCNEK